MPNAAAPRAARQALDAFGAKMNETMLSTGRLLVSELVTNSVEHGPDGTSRIELRASSSRIACASK